MPPKCHQSTVVESVNVSHNGNEKPKSEKKESEKPLEYGGSNVPSELENKPFLTPKNLQDLLGVSKATVYRYFEQGIIKAVRIRQRTLISKEVETSYTHCLKFLFTTLLIL